MACIGTPKGLSYSFNSESTYDWENEEWSIPINAFVTQVTKWGNQVVSYGGGVRYWAKSTDGGPEGWGLRLQLVFVFPNIVKRKLYIIEPLCDVESASGSIYNFIRFSWVLILIVFYRIIPDTF